MMLIDFGEINNSFETIETWKVFPKWQYYSEPV